MAASKDSEFGYAPPITFTLTLVRLLREDLRAAGEGVEAIEPSDRTVEFLQSVMVPKYGFTNPLCPVSERQFLKMSFVAWLESCTQIARASV